MISPSEKNEKKTKRKTYFVTSQSISQQITRICESQNFEQLAIEGGVGVSEIELENFISLAVLCQEIHLLCDKSHELRSE